MKEKKTPARTLAAVLDHTHWDYSTATDRRFLLVSVEKVFASVAWEIAHWTPCQRRSTRATHSSFSQRIGKRSAHR